MAIPNPFMPGFGRIPRVAIARPTELTTYLSGLTSRDPRFQTSLVYATRATGKTVFLLTVQRALINETGWHFLRLSLGQDNLRFQLLSGLQRITGKRVSTADHVTVIANQLAILRKRKESVLIAIDEIEISQDVQNFGNMYQSLIGQDYPLALLMTGLPTRVSEVQNDGTLTFLLLANRVQLNPLDQEAVRNTYQEVFEKGGRQIDYLVLDRLAAQVKGYAYAFQTIGYYAWRYSQQSLVIDEKLYQEVIAATKQDLFRNTYERMYHDSSATDRLLLRAIAKLNGNEPVATKELQEELGWAANYLSVYRARLIDTELISAPQRGVVQFNLPLFAEFIDSLVEQEEL